MGCWNGSLKGDYAVRKRLWFAAVVVLRVKVMLYYESDGIEMWVGLSRTKGVGSHVVCAIIQAVINRYSQNNRDLDVDVDLVCIIIKSIFKLWETIIYVNVI